jgi:hypothetical protein
MVKIPFDARFQTKTDRDNYTAVLVGVAGTRKVILMQYQGDTNLPGWWTRVYDAH